MRKRIIIAVAMLLTLLGTAASCDEKGLGDAPLGEAREAPRDVIVNLDQFPNVVVMCDGPTRIYTNTRDGYMGVVPDHPACEGEDPIDEQGDEVEYEVDSEG